jgi:hypothetical protein
MFITVNPPPYSSLSAPLTTTTTITIMSMEIAATAPI